MSPVTHTTGLRAPRAASSAAIRTRYMSRLGIHAPPSPTQASSSPSCKQHKDNIENKPVAVLKADGKCCDPDVSEASTASTRSCSTSGSLMERSGGKSVTFDSSVKVYPVPSRSDYSERTHAALWVSTVEIERNITQSYIDQYHPNDDGYGAQDAVYDIQRDRRRRHRHARQLANAQAYKDCASFSGSLNWRFCALRVMQQQQAMGC